MNLFLMNTSFLIELFELLSFISVSVHIYYNYFVLQMAGQYEAELCCAIVEERFGISASQVAAVILREPSHLPGIILNLKGQVTSLVVSYTFKSILLSGLDKEVHCTLRTIQYCEI